MKDDQSDINPSNIRSQSLLISRDSNDASLDILLAASGDYMLTTELAQRIIDEIQTGMKSRQTIAHQCGIRPAERERFSI